MKPWEARDIIYKKFKAFYKPVIRFIPFKYIKNRSEEFEEKWIWDADYEKYKYYPFLYREVFPFEVVIDIDERDDSKLDVVIDVLETYDIEYNLFFSGNRGHHIHIIFNPEIYEMMTVSERKVVNDVFKRLREHLAKELSGVIDENVTKSTRRCILEVYSWNKCNQIKYVEEGYEWGDDVELIEFKYFNPFEKDLCDILSVRENVPVEEIRKIIRRRDRNKYWYIEKLLQLEGLTDGYHRFLLFFILPYLCNVKNLSEDEVYSIVTDWLEKQNFEYSEKNFDSWLRSNIRWVKNKGYLPMSLSTALTGKRVTGEESRLVSCFSVLYDGLDENTKKKLKEAGLL